MKKLEFNAKKLPIKTEERIESFLAYNFKCGKKSEEFQNALLIRYWISTLAAAYSDEILSKQEVLDRLGKITKTFRMPDLFFYLECDYDERILRIKQRNLLGENVCDDITKYRDIRYQEIVISIEEKLINFIRIPVTNVSVEKTLETIKYHINLLTFEKK